MGEWDKFFGESSQCLEFAKSLPANSPEAGVHLLYRASKEAQRGGSGARISPFAGALVNRGAIVSLSRVRLTRASAGGEMIDT